ncbi:hypothetical protein AMS68_003981 [Peltaster fructicola]|uniref:RING-type E3 ubiquitin transferase n=1 Tax=Peltaster fructicola TaxID=286661 RepID=A0A6H0XUQ4_9PEZI|nr:hypothetical protein AMS68_003981 [Peltaster fructicola]
MDHNQFHTVGATTAAQSRTLDRNAVRPLPPRPRTPRADSSDRKRRLTSPDQGRAHTFTMTAGSHYHSLANHPGRGHDDLAARVLPHFRQSQGPTMSDIVPPIPQWQPDEDVQKCPVCQQEFTLFFRKHHCRKCGKVVCGDCSRHRITVPLRFVAQPPWAADSILQYPGASAPVRVCNPCVPDPWSPTENEQPPPVPPPDTRPRAFNRYSLPPPPPSGMPGHAHRHSSDVSRHYRQHEQHMPPQPGQIAYRRLAPGIAYGSPQAQSQSLDTRSQLAATPAQPTPAPRRIVKEEDECPVCGVELAPGDATREAHIASCVTTRFGSLDTARTPPVPSSVDDAGIVSSSSDPASRARAQSYRSRGLYQYKATEKDCVDGEGEEQECPICFEEFQPGETLGRLECLCRFHHKCIREWWVRRGPGMCPVHASHE